MIVETTGAKALLQSYSAKLFRRNILTLPAYTMNEKARRDLCRNYVHGTSVAQLATEYSRSIHTIKGLLNTHLHNGKYRTLSDIRQVLRQTPKGERWKPLRLPTKTPYFISDYGRIRNEKSGAVLNLRIVFGYFSFEYYDQDLQKKKAKLVHVLTAAHWLKAFDPERDTVHLDFDKFNNYYRNLRQATPGERARRVAEAHRSRHFKVTSAIVKKIKSSGESPSVLASRFDVSTMQVLRIQRGDCWGHILPEKTRPKQPTPATPPQTVAKIKTLLAAGKKGTAIAAILNVTETTVSRIKRGKTYK